MWEQQCSTKNTGLLCHWRKRSSLTPLKVRGHSYECGCSSVIRILVPSLILTNIKFSASRSQTLDNTKGICPGTFRIFGNPVPGQNMDKGSAAHEADVGSNKNCELLSKYLKYFLETRSDFHCLFLTKINVLHFNCMLNVFNKTSIVCGSTVFGPWIAEKWREVQSTNPLQNVWVES